jgi:hypothetical protein
MLFANLPVRQPGRMACGLSTYQEIGYHELWTGVDLIFYSSSGQIKYDFVIRPGAWESFVPSSFRPSQSLGLRSILIPDQYATQRLGTI